VSAWTLNAQASISGGQLHLSSGFPSAFASQTATITIVPGTYNYSIDVISTDGGGEIQVIVGGTNRSVPGSDAPGHYEGSVTSTATNQLVSIRAPGVNAVVDNFHVYQLVEVPVDTVIARTGTFTSTGQAALLKGKLESGSFSLAGPDVGLSYGSLGPELVQNGNFSSSVGWSLSIATISGGQLSYPATFSGVAAVQALDTIVSGSTYRAKLTIVSTDGTDPVQIRVGGVTQGNLPMSPGTYVVYLPPSGESADQNLLLNSQNSAFVADDFSVKRVTTLTT
jgi:hypothetical protein